MIINAASLALPLASGSVDACLCSPPYWGALRIYRGPQARAWPVISYAPMPGLPPVEIPGQRVALGHEPDPFAFVGHLLQVFRDVRRVLVPACILGDDPEAGQVLAEIGPALMRIGELALEENRIVRAWGGDEQQRRRLMDVRGKLETVFSEYRSRFPDPTVLPELIRLASKKQREAVRAHAERWPEADP